MRIHYLKDLMNMEEVTDLNYNVNFLDILIFFKFKFLKVFLWYVLIWFFLG